MSLSSDQIKQMLAALRCASELLRASAPGKNNITPEQMATIHISTVIDILTGEDNNDAA